MNLIDNMKILNTNTYLLLIDEEAEIKEGDYRVHIYEKTLNHPVHRLEHGENTFDTWRLVLAYYPLNSEAKELDLPALPNPFEVDFNDLEWNVIADKDWKSRGGEGNKSHFMYRQGYIHGAYKALQTQSKQFSLEDVVDFVEWTNLHYRDLEHTKAIKNVKDTKELFNYYLTLSTQQLPKEFIPEYENVDVSELVDMNGNYNGESIKHLKTITNSEGKEELIGTYKY